MMTFGTAHTEHTVTWIVYNCRYGMTIDRILCTTDGSEIKKDCMEIVDITNIKHSTKYTCNERENFEPSMSKS